MFSKTESVLEIGSGTGQHAVHFSKHLSHLVWQPTELGERVAMLKSRIDLEGPGNLLPAKELDVLRNNWELEETDAVFIANVFHIAPIEVMHSCLKGTSKCLKRLGIFCVYGPFRFEGEFTSPSNAQFDCSLKTNNPKWGIRDFEQLCQVAEERGLTFQHNYSMPANNQLLVFKKHSQTGNLSLDSTQD
ncbi:MAG: class I SAM-dependent methyltransferase [SAR324 cluster bacterium]|nr:class I SAM-dependent methyltransferase [SAR324 cluster bacterium]